MVLRPSIASVMIRYRHYEVTPCHRSHVRGLLGRGLTETACGQGWREKRLEEGVAFYKGS